MSATAMVTVRKPVAQAGTWTTQVGDGTITLQDLESVVAAQADQGVPRTRVTLGHTVAPTDNGVVRVPRPVLGHADRYEMDGDTLFADLHLPKWLADEMERVAPARSIEGSRQFVTDGGKHDMVIPVLALLSDELPAIDTIDDWRDVVTRTDPAVPDTAGDAALVAASRLVVCALPQTNRAAPAATTTTQEGDPMAETEAEQEAPETNPDENVTTEPAAETPEEEGATNATELPELPAGYTYISEATLAKLTEGAETAQKLADDLAEKEAEDFARGVVAATKELPGEEERVAVAYKENPKFVRAFYDRVKPGAAAPVGQLSTFSRGAVATEPTGDLPPSAIRYSAAERERLGLNQEA